MISQLYKKLRFLFRGIWFVVQATMAPSQAAIVCVTSFFREDDGGINVMTGCVTKNLPQQVGVDFALAGINSLTIGDDDDDSDESE